MGKALKILSIMSLFMSFSAQAKVVKVEAIGSSPKGQYVAIEEFGYHAGSKKPFSKIRVLNLWKNQYVDKPIQVFGSKKESSLEDIRQKALSMATAQLKKFHIKH